MLRSSQSFVCVFLVGLSAFLAASSAESDDRIVLGGVEMCGPVGDAVEFLLPRKKKLQKKWQKEHERSAVKNYFRFDKWNSSISWGPASGRKIVLVGLDDRVYAVILKSLTRELGPKDGVSWHTSLTDLYGDPDFYGDAKNGIVDVGWTRPNGVQIELTLDTINGESGLVYFCLLVSPPELNTNGP